MQPNVAATAITWFEIPVLDTQRARKFYETVLDIEMDTQFMSETDEELTFFPFEPGVIRATSGKVSGALVKNNRTQPSANGTTVYLDAGASLQAALDKVVPAGGKIITPKTPIRAGYIAIIMDTEGNKLGLHALS